MTFLAQVLAECGSDFGHMNWGGGGWWMMPFSADDPLDGARRILAERYARGELDSEEYQERSERLS